MPAEYLPNFEINHNVDDEPVLTNTNTGESITLAAAIELSAALDVAGAVTADSATLSGALTADSATVTNALAAGSANVTGTVDAATADVDTLTATDATVANGPTDATDVAIKEYVDSVAQGLDWQDSVIDELNDPPGTPAEGDRYLVDTAPTGAWVGHAEEIAEWDGSAWEFFAPNDGWSIFIEDIDLLEVYNAGSWVAFGSAIDHGALAGLGDDDHTQYILADGTRSFTGSIEINNDTIAQSVVASGQVALSSGEATVDTGVSAVDATFTLALGVDDPNADVDLAGRLFWDDSAGTYKIQIVEGTTSVGNPTANYDVVRVR